MHGQNINGRHDIIHDTKNALFHFASILSTEDNHFFFFEGDIDGCFREDLIGELVCGEFTGINNEVIGVSKVFELCKSGVNEHIMHKESMVGSGADDSDFLAIARVPACVGIDDVDIFTGIEVIDSALSINQESTFIHRDIDAIIPPDLVLTFGVFNDSFIFGVSSSFFT